VGDTRPINGHARGDRWKYSPGASLSSSAALCVAAYGAVCAQNGRTLDPAAWILAARDAEWYTGARTGTSDQAASILCRANAICNVTLLAEDFSLDGIRHVPFPSGHTLLVINSHTRRSLSGAQKIAYTKNRFAYSMAMQVFQREWPTPSEAIHFDRLSRITINDVEILDRVYDTLLRVPEQISLNTLRERYRFSDLDAQYKRYFGDMPAAEAPTDFDQRGPLLYGIGESERAREFSNLITQGDLARAGTYMNIGHNGDRVSNTRRVDEHSLREARAHQLPITALCGDYGASSPALDALVDAALRGGALGACLTGAGIAGCVIVLCRDEAVDAVKREVINVLRDSGLNPSLLEEAVIENRSANGAGEVPWPI
jgi:galactokinase